MARALHLSAGSMTWRYLLASSLLVACVGGEPSLGTTRDNIDSTDPFCSALTPAQLHQAAIDVYANQNWNGQTCFDDSKCPCGSHCGVNSSVCEVECVPSPAPGEPTCGAGKACTPAGRCADAPNEPPPALAISIAFADPETSANTTAGPIAVPVSVTTSAISPIALDDAEDATVHFSIEEVREQQLGLISDAPPVSPLLRCGPSGPFTPTCDLAGGWTFNITSSSIKSNPRQVWVQIPQTASALHWTLEARSGNATGTSRELVDATPHPVPKTDPGHYKGTLSFTNTGSPANQAVSIPIEAIVTPNVIAVLEPTKLVFAGGQSVIPRTTQKAVQLGWLTATGGRYDVLLRYTDSEYDPTSGHLDANVDLSNGTGAADTLLSLSLDRTGDVDAPACPCASGSYCNTSMAACLPGTTPPTESLVDPTTALPSSTLASDGIAKWTAPVLTKAHMTPLLNGAGTTGFQEAYCFEATNQPGLAKFGLDLTPAPISGDLRCTRADPRGTLYVQPTFAFENAATEFDDGTGGGATYDLYQSCALDLARQPDPTSIPTLFPPRACASLSRFYLALAANRDGSGRGVAMPDIGQRLVMQILRQWLGVNAYVANTAVQERDYDDALSILGSPAYQRLGTMLDQVDADLRVLLDPEVRPQFTTGAALPVVLSEPDYRIRPRAVTRWSFNVSSNLGVDSEGTNAFDTTGATSTGSMLLAQGQPSAACNSTQTVGLNDRRYSIVFALDFKPPTGSTTTIFDKTGPSGDRLRIDATPATTLGRMNLRMYDAQSRSVTFNNVSSGLIAITVDGSTYQLYSAAVNGSTTATLNPTAIVNGGPSWGAAGMVHLNCNLPPNPDICTSWDHKNLGDGLDYTVRAPFVEHSATSRYTCTDYIAPPFTHSCTGTQPTQQACTNIATARLPQLVSQINSTLVSPASPPPAAPLAAVATHGSLATVDEGMHSYPKYELSWTDWRCDTTVSNYIDPITGQKPICGWYGQASWDEVSLWDRPVQLSEFADMATRYLQHGDSMPPSTALAGDEQAAALPVHVLEAASADLQLLTAYTQAERTQMYGECYHGGASPARDRVASRGGRNLRLVSVLEGEAEHLVTIAGGASATWYPRYAAAQRQLAGQRALAVQALVEASKCENPLGITEQDIPLYVGEDAANPSARFFASSRYLTGEAAQEISTANGYLDRARTAYTAQREGAYQLAAAAETKEQRVSDLQADAESQLLRYCGPPSGTVSLVDGMSSGSITENNCFIDLSLPQCAGYTNASIAATPTECLRGELGAQVLAIKTAAVVMNNANQTLVNAIARYDGDLEQCAEEQRAFTADETALRDHDKIMETLHKEEALVDTALGFIKAGIEGANRAGAAAAVGAIQTGVDGAFAATEQQEQDNYAEGVLHRSNDEKIAACYHETDNEKFQIDGARDQITLAKQQLEDAAYQLSKDMDEVGGIVDIAAGRIATALSLDASPPHLHYWLDQNISAYHRHLEYARRLTYLALRAYEYESQSSIQAARGATLGAAVPDDLLTVVDAIDGYDAPLAGELNGMTVGNPIVVLSLRDEILKVARTAGYVPGDPQLAPVDLFKHFLASDSSKILDAHGKFVGRGIRFAIAPDTWSQTTCDERIWRVQSSLQSDGTPNQHMLVLYQENTFGSQDCHGEVGDVVYTPANPASNLLVSDATTFTTTSPLTAVNIDGQPSLDHEGLRNQPESTIAGLAGRGIYGNYVLLFQEPLWSEADIAHVKDVLLRFDLSAVTHAPVL